MWQILVSLLAVGGAAAFVAYRVLRWTRGQRGHDCAFCPHSCGTECGDRPTARPRRMQETANRWQDTKRVT